MAQVNITSLVLNAHPACDRATDTCYVQHPCPAHKAPLSHDVCFSRLEPGEGESDMQAVHLSHATLDKAKLIQHSHSPCVTPNFVVSKLDAFTARNPVNANGGLLKYEHQGEDNVWLVMDRSTNASRIMTGGPDFVNNHFWNCYEDDGGDVIVEAVAATGDYLDNYFRRNLDQTTADWNKIFHPPLRCKVPKSGLTITCGDLLPNEPSLIFDYPTFNPYFKMRPEYQFFYAIAPLSTNTSRWFDSIVKVNAKEGRVVAQWSSPGIFMTEADFVPRSSSTAAKDEDDGVLLTVLYNSTSDTSSVAVFEASSITLLRTYPLGTALPFHAHGIVCPGNPSTAKWACFTNP